MLQKNEKPRDTKLLQVHIEPELHKALQRYCIDSETKNAPVVRELLTEFLEARGYYNKQRGK